MKKTLESKKGKGGRLVQLNRAELERKAVKGAERAAKDYRRVFERLAKYDRG